MTAPDPMPPAAGSVKQTTTVETKVEQPNKFSRRVEDGGLLLCLVLFALWMAVAVMRSAGYIVGPCKNLGGGFPWEFVVSGATFALPKVLGRATAGRIWGTVAGRGQPPPPDAP